MEKGQMDTGNDCRGDLISTPAKKYPDYCRTLTFRDASGQVKELVLPKALDLDRPKRARTTFSPDQLFQLEAEFNRNQYLVGRERTQLAHKLGLSETQVKVWFQNRRTKYKRDRTREDEIKPLSNETAAATIFGIHPHQAAPSTGASSLPPTLSSLPIPASLSSNRSIPSAFPGFSASSFASPFPCVPNSRGPLFRLNHVHQPVRPLPLPPVMPSTNCSHPNMYHGYSV